MSISSEVADLAILLCIICVPLAVGAVFIPIGRALADRLRNDRHLREDQEAMIRALQMLDVRLRAIEDATADNAATLERLGGQRLQELSSQRRDATPRLTTPH